MIKLTLFPSNNTYEYKTKSKALREVKDNGLNSNQYILEDTENSTQYKQGLWLTQEELNIVSGAKTISRGIKLVKYYRKSKK